MTCARLCFEALIGVCIASIVALYPEVVCALGAGGLDEQIRAFRRAGWGRSRRSRVAAWWASLSVASELVPLSDFLYIVAGMLIGLILE